MAYDDKLDGGGKRLATSSEVLQKPTSSYEKEIAEHEKNPHLNEGELQKACGPKRGPMRGKK